MKQKTIKEPIKLSGKGLHTGNLTEVIFEPAPPDSGVKFIRMDLPGQPEIKALVENVIDIERGTTLGCGEVKVHTVEHVLSAFAGMNIYNVNVKISGNEPPALDGSSRPFVEAILKSGIHESDVEQPVFKVEKFYEVTKNDKKILIIPHKSLRVSFTIDYPHPKITVQHVDFESSEAGFIEEINGARTFGFVSDYDELKKKGQALGASLENTVALSEDKILNPDLRYPDEFVRHKVLDVLGDLYLLGLPIIGHVIAFKTGHAHNVQLVKQLRTDLLGRKNMVNWNINDIKKILPHRFPFLLIDRIIEIVDGKKAVGIKNVTANESFFNGHFPQQPVMPGVLIIEAMAQVSCACMLSQTQHAGKLPYFTGIDNVRFRQPVIPGDCLELTVNVLKVKGSMGKVLGEARVNEKLVASGELMFSLVDAGK